MAVIDTGFQTLPAHKHTNTTGDGGALDSTTQWADNRINLGLAQIRAVTGGIQTRNAANTDLTAVHSHIMQSNDITSTLGQAIGNVRTMIDGMMYG